MLVRQLLEEREIDRRKGLQRSQFDDGLGLRLRTARGSTMMLTCRALPRLETDLRVVRRHVGQQDALLLHGALADQAFAQAMRLGRDVRRMWRSSASSLRPCVPSSPGQVVDGALLGLTSGRQLGREHLGRPYQVALALQHAGELGEVGLQPILLAVALRGLAEVGDHRVDVVFQLGDLAARLDLNRAGEVALGHGGGDLGDGADLGGEIGRRAS